MSIDRKKHASAAKEGNHCTYIISVMNRTYRSRSVIQLHCRSGGRRKAVKLREK